MMKMTAIMILCKNKKEKQTKDLITNRIILMILKNNYKINSNNSNSKKALEIVYLLKK